MTLNRWKALLVTLVLATSSAVFATDDGTWHGDDHGVAGSASAVSYNWLLDLLSICVG